MDVVSHPALGGVHGGEARADFVADVLLTIVVAIRIVLLAS